MSRYGIELYATLEAETGLATGWKQCGSLNVAKTPERLKLFRRQMARAKSFGIEFEFVSPAEAGKIYPLLRTDDLAGAVWIPGDGKANPTDLTQSLARGARMRGVRIVEDAKVIALVVERGRVARVRYRTVDAEAEVHCESVVNCAGQWARQLGLLAGANVPLHSAEHLSGHPADSGRAANLPVMRDPEATFTTRKEVGGLVMGGFEPVAKPWNVGAIPDPSNSSFCPRMGPLRDPDADAIHRTPCLETRK